MNLQAMRVCILTSFVRSTLVSQSILRNLGRVAVIVKMRSGAEEREEDGEQEWRGIGRV